MCAAMLAPWHWILNNLDRILSLIAVVIATIAIIDVRHLFQRLEKRDKDTEDRVRKAVLKELLTFTASFATYSRAAQFIDFFEGQPDRETAIAMLVAFRIQQLISPEGKKEEFAELRRTTRNQVEKEAAVWAQTIIDSGLGKLKEGWDFNRPPDGK
jgi:hypothetical protein